QIAVVNAFMPLATVRGRSFSRWQAHASRLKSAIDESAWDGDWFVRDVVHDFPFKISWLAFVFNSAT
ncbi:MAG: hypothetical protein ACO3BO_02675, partial [Anaerohalosphaeraceae bacterium]